MECACLSKALTNIHVQNCLFIQNSMSQPSSNFLLKQSFAIKLSSAAYLFKYTEKYWLETFASYRRKYSHLFYFGKNRCKFWLPLRWLYNNLASNAGNFGWRCTKKTAIIHVNDRGDSFVTFMIALRMAPQCIMISGPASGWGGLFKSWDRTVRKQEP